MAAFIPERDQALQSPELLRIARRVVWWEPPERVLSRLDDFLCRVMSLATFEDAAVVEAAFGKDRMRDALQNAAPGVIDIRSWHYWHHRLGIQTVRPWPTGRTFA